MATDVIVVSIFYRWQKDDSVELPPAILAGLNSGPFRVHG